MLILRFFCKNCWSLQGNGRKPNGIITVLLKEFWPGLFCPRPDRDPEMRVLATTWAHYEAASCGDYGTAAKAVITKFWVSSLQNHLS